MKRTTEALNRFRWLREFKRRDKANKNIFDKWYIKIGGEAGLKRLLDYAAKLREELKEEGFDVDGD